MWAEQRYCAYIGTIQPIPSSDQMITPTPSKKAQEKERPSVSAIDDVNKYECMASLFRRAGPPTRDAVRVCVGVYER